MTDYYDEICDYFAYELDAAFQPFAEAGFSVNVSAAWVDDDPDMVRLTVAVDGACLIDVMVCGTCQGPLETIRAVLDNHRRRVLQYLIGGEAKRQIVVPVTAFRLMYDPPFAVIHSEWGSARCWRHSFMLFRYEAS